VKNRINFYHKSLRKRRDLMPLQGVLVIWTIVAFIVTASWGGFTLQTQHNKTEKDGSQQRLDSLYVELEAIKIKLAEKQNKDRLVTKLKLIEQEIAHKQQIFSYLKVVNELSGTDYSRIMIDLARHHEPSIWLTELIFAGKKITLKGQTSESSQLPIWLSNLKQSPYFAGKEFSVLEFNKKEDGINEFNVSSELVVKGNSL